MEEVPKIPRASPMFDAAEVARDMLADFLKEDVLSWEEAKTRLPSSADHEERQLLSDILRVYESHEAYMEEIRDAEKDIMRKCALAEVSKRQNRKDAKNILPEDPDKYFLNKFPLIKFSCLRIPPHKRIIEEYEHAFNEKQKQARLEEDSLLPIPGSVECWECMDKVPEQSAQDQLETEETITEEKKEPVIFTAVPEAVEFRNYVPGMIYEASIKLKNVSKYNAKFDIEPRDEKSRFSTSCIFPDKKTQIVAAGLTAIVKIYFHCKSFEVLQEELKINVPNGKDISIKMSAWREAPILKSVRVEGYDLEDLISKGLSQFIDTGTCLVGDVFTTTLLLRNERAAGRFCFMSEEDWIYQDVRSLSTDNRLYIPPFMVTPAHFKLKENEMIELQVHFAPDRSGLETEVVYVLCDSCTVLDIDIIGDAIMLGRDFLQLYEEKRYATKSATPPFKTTVKRKKIELVEDEEFTLYAMNIGYVSQNTKQVKTIVIKNTSPAEMRYYWKWKLVEPLVTIRGLAREVCENICEIIPDKGLVFGQSTDTCQITFNTEKIPLGSYTIIAELYVGSIPAGSIENFRQFKKIEEAEGFCMELVNVLFSELKISLECVIPQQVCIPRELPPCICLGSSLTNIGKRSVLVVQKNGSSGRGKADVMFSNQALGQLDSAPAAQGEHASRKADFSKETVPSKESARSVRSLRSAKSVKSTKSISETTVSTECPCTEKKEPEPIITPTSSEISDVVLDWDRLEETLEERAPAWKELHTPVECPVLNVCGPLYVGVESQYLLRLKNAAWFPEPFRWGCPVGEQRSALKLALCPLSGTVPPASTVSVRLTLTPLIQGTIKDLYIPCLSRRSKSPIYLQIICTVENLHVTFELPTAYDYAKQHFVQNIKFYHIPWFSDNVLQPRETVCSYLGTKKDVMVHDGNLTDKTQLHKKSKHRSTSEEFSDGETSKRKASELNYDQDPGSLQTSNFSGIESFNIFPTIFPYTELEPNILLPVYEPKVKHRSSLKTIEERKTKYSELSRRGDLQRKKSITLSEKEIRSMFEGFSRGVKKRKKFLKRSQEELVRRAELEQLRYIYRTTANSFIVMVPLLHCRELHMNSSKMLPVTEEIMPVRYKSHAETHSSEITTLTHSESSSKETERECTFINAYEKDYESVTSDAYSSISFTSSTTCDGSTVTEEKSSTTSIEETVNQKKSILPFLQNLILDAVPVRSIIQLLNVPCSQAVKTTIVIRNETLISSSVKLSIKNFTETEKKPKQNIIAEAKKKVYGIAHDHWKSRIREGKGIVIVLQPSSSHLAPKDALIVDIWIYGDTWGTYYDEISCCVDGLPPLYIQLIVQVVGLPASFALRQDVKTNVPTLCFGTLPYHSQCKTRKVFVRNQSCLKMIILWHLFVTEPLEDNKPENDPFNLVFDICSPLTKKKNNMESYKSTAPECASKHSGSGTMQRPFLDSCIRFGIIPFQGREKYKYFQVFPRETVLEPFGEATLKLTVNPCICDQDTRFTPLRAVLAGFMHISEEDRFCPDTYEREMGYNLRPLKMKIEADIEIPYLCLETPEEDCNFRMYATEIMSNVNKIHKEEKVIRVKNYNNAEAIVVFSTYEPFTLSKVSTSDGTVSNRRPGDTVIIHKNVTAELTVQCKISQNYVGEALLALQDPKCKELIVTKDQRVVEFESCISVTQGKFLHQYIPVKISIIFPTIHVSEELLDFGKVCRGQTKEMILTLKNNTDATITMEFILRNDDKNFSVHPTEGVLYSASSGGNTMDLTVQFSSAQANNMPYEDGLLIVTSVPQDFFEVELTATAVLDEKFSLHK